MLANGRAFFAGAGEAGKPGAIQIWRYPDMEPISEVQAHSGPIERMRLSYNNDFLFTAGKDGCLMIHEVKDRDSRAGATRVHSSAVMYSDEILTEKGEMDDIKAERDRLQLELASARDPSHSNMNEKASANDLEDKIKKLREQISSQTLMIRSKIEQLEASKSEIEDQFEKQLRQ